MTFIISFRNIGPLIIGEDGRVYTMVSSYIQEFVISVIFIEHGNNQFMGMIDRLIVGNSAPIRQLKLYSCAHG